MEATSLVMSIIAIAIAFVSLLWNIVSKIMNDRHIIHCYASLGYVVGGSKTEKVITINVTNASKFIKFVNTPMLRIFAEKKKGRVHLLPKYSYGPINEPIIELAPGKSTSLSSIIGASLMEYFIELTDDNTVRFVVSDALQHRYLSNSLKMKKVKEFYNEN